QRLDVDGSPFSHTADIIASEIHQHNMLGSFLGIGKKTTLQFRVLIHRRATPSGSGNRTYRDKPVLTPHKNFWRRAHEFNPCNPEVIHVRRRIHEAQGPIELKGRSL